MAKEKAMEAVGSTAIAQPMASGARGFENFKSEDLVIPRLRLLQGLSGAVIDGSGKMGQFQDSLTGEILGEEVEIILLGMQNGAVYFESGEGMVCKSPDGIMNMEGIKCTDCPYNQYYGTRWKKDEEPPKCSATKEFVCITKGTVEGKEQHPIVVSFLKTSYKMGKKLASIARLSGRDIFAASYSVTSEMMKNKKGSFAIMNVKQCGWLKPEELAAAEAWYHTLGQSNVVVHEASEQVAEESDII